jgi:hypothetical protein
MSSFRQMSICSMTRRLAALVSTRSLGGSGAWFSLTASPAETG